jgi:enoyl-CoA hydratase/carnithine racemase
LTYANIETVTGSVASITMNRPDKRNALSFEMMDEIVAALRDLGARQETRVIVLAGNGPAFSAGHDLTEMTAGDEEAHRRIFDRCVELMAAIQEVPQPVIAQVHAIATAAGCQLVATCDLAVAADSARFATPGVKIGLFCTTPMVALTRAVGRKRAMEMLLTGIAIDAATAAEWGLVNKVVPAAQLEEATQLLARQICEASPYTVALGKRAFYALIDLDQDSAYAAASDTMCTNAAAGDAQEGMSAFLQKRKPVWKGGSDER